MTKDQPDAGFCVDMRADRAGSLSPATSINSARWLNRNASLSNDRERHRWAGQLCADLLYEAHPRLGQATGSVSRRKLQMQKRTSGNYFPQLTIEEQAGCKHQLTRA